jgi:hypothetical protein
MMNDGQEENAVDEFFGLGIQHSSLSGHWSVASVDEVEEGC